MTGSARRHGGHHVAQKSRSNTRPRKEEDETTVPLLSVKWKSGALNCGLRSPPSARVESSAEARTKSLNAADASDWRPIRRNSSPRLKYGAAKFGSAFT